MNSSSPLAVTLGVLIWLILKTIRRIYSCPLSKVPGPKLAAVTYLNEFYHGCIRNRWGSYLESLHERYGPIVRINPNEVHILDHDFNYVHFNKRSLDKEERYFQLAPRSTATITPHVDHKKHRDFVMPLFNGRLLREFEVHSLPPYISKLDIRLQGFAESGRAVDLAHLLWAVSNDILVKYVFGAELHLLSSDDLATGYYQLRNFNATRLAGLFRQWPLSLLFRIRSLPVFRYIAVLPVESLTHNLIQLLFSAPEDNEDKSIVTVARVLFDNHELYPDRRSLNSECAEFMLGGTEALTYNLIHIFHQLMTHPKAMEQLREELNGLQVDKGSTIWEGPRVVHLKYLNAIIREALRLNDSEAIRFVRQSREAVIYNGFIIPPKTTISMTEKFINWDPEIFPEPEKFKPERWLSDEPEVQRARRLSVAFGMGNRTCVAKDLTLSIMTRVVAAAVTKYDISFQDEAEKDGWGIGYLKLFPSASAVGPKIAVKPRQA